VEDGVNVKVGVELDVGVSVIVGVKVLVGVDVRVHDAALSVSAAMVMLTCASMEGPHPPNAKQIPINMKQNDLI
jgi:hypothetical protein